MAMFMKTIAGYMFTRFNVTSCCVSKADRVAFSTQSLINAIFLLCLQYGKLDPQYFFPSPGAVDS